MFTGLIEKTGKLSGIKVAGDAASVSIECKEWGTALVDGESVAVQGACLTVTSSNTKGFTADLLKETMDKTTFSQIKPGDIVNLERALRAGDRMGGHIVTGHVDGVGSVKELKKNGRDWVLTINCSSNLTAEIVNKGSITINGVSLTVSDCDEASFTVNIIPFTWSETSLAVLKEGSPVNLETDIIAKYIAKSHAQVRKSEVTMETLRNAGFA